MQRQNSLIMIIDGGIPVDKVVDISETREENMLERVCPVCSSGQHYSVHSVNFEDNIGLLSGYNVVACSDCGMVFATPLPEPSVFEHYYTTLSKYDSSLENISIYDQERFQLITKFISTFLKNETRVLDLGCGSGGLLRELKKFGYTHLFGLDPSKAVADYYEGRKSNIKVFTGYLETCEIPRENTYDLIILEAVLEHIPDVHAFLGNVLKLLSKDGLLYIGVPNLWEFKKCNDGPFQQFSIEHINYFSSVSLNNLMNEKNLSMLSIEQIMLPGAPGIFASGIMGIWKREINKMNNTIVKDNYGLEALKDYITLSMMMLNNIEEILKSVKQNEREIYVWGTGTHTFRLLAATSLGTCNIKAFIDMNPHYVGRLVRNIPIKLPGSWLDSSTPILISSKIAQSEIEQYIKTDLKLSNPIIKLYRD